MDLMRAVKAYGTDDFASIVADELEQNSSDLPLEMLMDNGGWLAEDAEVAVNGFSDDGKTITANVTVYFDEKHRSGCVNITRTDSYRAEFAVVIDMASGDADFENETATNTTHDDDVDDMNFDDRADRDYRNSEF